MGILSLTGSSNPFLAQVLGYHSSISTSNIHPYVPFTIFGVLHAIRIATAHRAGARAGGFENRLTVWQSALAPMILIFGGTTMTNVLLGMVPGWVVSPLPVLNYGLIPVLASYSPIVPLLLSLPAVPREVLFAVVDGFTRCMGITTFGVESVINHPEPAVRNSPWAMIIVATLAGGGGGIIMPAIKGFHADWGFTTPPYVKDGPGIDIWGAGFIGIVYATLVDAHPFFRLLPALLQDNVPGFGALVGLPKGYATASGRNPLLPAQEARIACSLLLGSMLVFKVLSPLLLAPGAPAKKKTKSTKSGVVAPPSGPLVTEGTSTGLSAGVSSAGLKKKKSGQPLKK